MRFRASWPPVLAAMVMGVVFSPQGFALADGDVASPPSESASKHAAPASSQTEEIVIDGPLRPFLRMAGISQELPTEDVLPTLAHNVFSLGGPPGHPKEYLILLQRYVLQSRELQALAGPGETIRVDRCEDSGPLLEVLGYRWRGACGKNDAVLTTAEPERAFLTVDSGFPLTQLEVAMQSGKSFTFPYAPTRIPVVLQKSDWAPLNRETRKAQGDLLDVILHDPELARLYWAVSRMDPETRVALRRSPGLPSLLSRADVLDFYGSQICIRSKKVLVPGGTGSERAWEALVGASPKSSGDFVIRLISQDRGWLAAYYDTLARLDATQQAHFTEEPRLRRLYENFRDSSRQESAAKGSFRGFAQLLVLCTRQQWAPDGQPVIPGNLDIWKQVVGKRAQRWSGPEQVLEAVVASSRSYSERNLTHLYLTLSELDIDRARPHLAPATMTLLAKAYPEFGDWYPIFSEFRELDDDCIDRFVRDGQSLDRISSEMLRGDALGIFQANVGLWQILARQREIPKDRLVSSWESLMQSFSHVESPARLVDAGYKSLGDLSQAATGRANLSQDELIEALAGPRQRETQGDAVRMEIAAKMRAVMDDQRLTSLDTLAALDRGLNAMAQGAPVGKEMAALAGQLREFEMPRRIFTESEKVEWAPGVFSQRHVELQMHTDLAKAIEQPTAARLEAARGRLAPFLRDTLVGLNYAYYESPGSQILHINPVFVRRHDFAAETVQGIDYVWETATVFGAGAPAGGGAYLVGSLADLPFVLASAEQDLIAPANVQALIWQEIVPDLLASATFSRWWNVSSYELRAVSLYQRSGEELLASSTTDLALREKVISILADRMSTLRLAQMRQAMESGKIDDEFARLLPADSFYLGAEFRAKFPQSAASSGEAAQSLEKLARQYPADASLSRISKDFGIPHPTLRENYGREMLNVKPFPAFAGYFSRSFGESWDSTNLYWARLADEKGYSPASLNLLSPQLTHLMVTRIFASHDEDWPAVVRAMRSAGDDFLQGKLGAPPPETTTTAQR
jgi:hypothetical protein